MTKNLDISTQLVHAGERADAPVGKPTSTPIYASSTYTYESMEQIDQVFGGEQAGYVYTRYGNPTLSAFETAMQTLEGGETACGYASGMAAIHAALLACELGTGATVVASQHLYGATTNLLLTIFGPLGVKTSFTDFSDLKGLREAVLSLRPRVLIAETISNPLLKVCDIPACAEIAHEVGARLIVDNTFGSPYLCQPLRHRADMVVHSATKFLGGHADAMGGIVVSRDVVDSTALVSVMKLVGGVLSPWEAHEILRGLKTLGVRMDRHCDNAKNLAQRLREHPAIGRVYYPAFDDPDGVARILRQPHAGALVSIELRESSREGAFRFMNAFRLCVRSTSLGDVFTSVMHPASSSHRDLAPARRRALGISDGLIRISVGIEGVDDISADFEQALARTESANQEPRHVGVAG